MITTSPARWVTSTVARPGGAPVHRTLALPLLAALILSACGGDGGGGGAPARTWTVSTNVLGGGAVSPAEMTVADGGTARFTLTPAATFVIGSVSGCGPGTLVDGVYTTAPVTAPCTVSATFVPTFAVGGTVTGLAGTVLLGNGGDQVRVSASGAFSFPTRLPAGGTYAVTVLAQPAGLECSVENGSGVVAGADVTDVAVRCVGVVSALYPLNGANWNDYVLSDGPDPLSARDVACTGTEVGRPSACVHGGERRVFRLPSLTSCAGLVASDSLEAFDWRCGLVDGGVRFVSRLKDGTRVSDLIDFTGPRWKDNQVVVRSGGAEVAASAPGRWWSNDLVIDDDGMTAGEMSAAGTLYLVSQDATGSYTFGADKVGLVIRRGAALSGDATSVITASGRTFLWLEGDVHAAGMANGINLVTTRFSVLRDVSVVDAASRGIYLVSSTGNRLQRVQVSGAAIGLNVYGSSGNTFLQVTAVGGGYGVINEASHDNVYLGLTAANNATHGLYPSSSRSNVFAGLALANNGSSGVYGHALSNSILADLMIAHTPVALHLSSGSANTFTGLLGVSGSTTNCAVSGGTDPGLVDGTCANAGSSDAILSTGISLATAFAGKVEADEPVNGSDTAGWANHPGGGSFDWLGFSHPLRSWGRDGGDFPSAGNQGRWVGGVGRVWDWSLRVADDVLRDRLGLPAGGEALTVSWAGGGSATFLRHAIEVDGDGDGLCESNEVCLYTPNVGAYQGHGEPLVAGTVDGDAVSGVTLLEHASNGR